ncbi:unnamed protein product [Rotaria sp. Silwood1]|nr:unnamed protein product [Rotaria sp. Silwood1]CAF3390607.1 unnamed protein product [Rotaria sp. Silwood1]CAF4761198.1 unnamed protein product [Rotaria sp. Silwood1]
MNNQTSNTSFSLNGQCFISQIQRSITIPVLIIFALPSFVCFLIIFYYFIQQRKPLLVDRINHHVILLILIFDFLLITTELPFTLSYLALGYAQTSKICTFWVYWDYILETTSLFLTMYASVERYLLVFHKNSFLKRKVLFHFIPMSIATLYIPILYLYLIVLSPCVRNYQYDLTAFTCGGACFFAETSVNTYDTIVDTMLPCFIVLIFNLLMIIRVVILKRKVATSVPISDTLRRNRRMIAQLLAISLMCLIAWMPWVVIIIAQNFFDPSFGTWFITYILHYLPYLTSSVSPFLALIGLPEVRQGLKILKKQTITTKTTTVSAPVHEMSKTAEKRNGPNTTSFELKTIEHDEINVQTT